MRKLNLGPLLFSALVTFHTSVPYVLRQWAVKYLWDKWMCSVNVPVCVKDYCFTKFQYDDDDDDDFGLRCQYFPQNLFLGRKETTEAGYGTSQEIKTFQWNMITTIRWRINTFVRFCQNNALNLIKFEVFAWEISHNYTKRAILSLYILNIDIAYKVGDILYFCYQQIPQKDQNQQYVSVSLNTFQRHHSGCQPQAGNNA